MGFMRRMVPRRVVVVLVPLGILVLAPSALGQAAVDQYVPAPGPDGVSADPPASGPGSDAAAGGGGGGGTDAEAPVSEKPPAVSATGQQAEGRSDRVSPTADSGEGTSSGVDLPGGFPVTPFVLIVAGLVAAAVAAKLLWTRIGGKEGAT